MSGWMFDTLVIGGGAAGMLAAITAAEQGQRVLILEKNDRPCRKLSITGKGRCNVTNDCPWQEVLENTPTNPRFLYTVMQAFPPGEVMAFFEALGCPLKVERGHRVFPESDRAASVVDALRARSRALGISLRQGTATRILTQEGRAVGAATAEGSFFARKVILATGGASYPRTGSTGDGYALAAAVGHTIVPPTGSLVPLESDSPLCPAAAGLCLKNVGLKLKWGGKTVYEDFGEAEFTDFGLTGATVLSASAHMGRKDGFTLFLDLKPALSEEKLDARLLRDLQTFRNCPMETVLGKLLPRQMILPLLHHAEISPSLAANSLTKAQRRVLLTALKALPFPITGKRPVEEAIVTSGGVKTAQVHPGTMESKLLPGLFFAGEILDVDAYTGGFNLQIAWATGHAAGKSAVHKAENKLRPL